MRNKNKKRKDLIREGTLFVFIVTCLLLGFKCNIWADNLSPLSVGDIEQAIAELSPPIDAEKISLIQSAINTQDQKERERLNQVLRKRMNGFFKINNTALAETEESRLFEKNTIQSQPVSHYNIIRQINDLKLGPKATAADLREREKIVGVIVGIEDPTIRYQLLEHLEDKEKESNSDN